MLHQIHTVDWMGMHKIPGNRYRLEKKRSAVYVFLNVVNDSSCGRCSPPISRCFSLSVRVRRGKHQKLAEPHKHHGKKNPLTFIAIHFRASAPTYRNNSPSCECILVGDEADQLLQVVCALILS